jgi:hypothetical protein
VPVASATRAKRQGVGANVRIEGFRRLCGELQPWRTGNDLRVLEAAKGSALVLPFVKGLRLSARLIYILRVDLSVTNLRVDWGQLLDKNDNSCSPECDIIIHKGYTGVWNDSDEPVMDFKFVKQDCAVAVISCKSYARDVDKEYVRKLRRYVKHVFLFAECCAPHRAAALRKKAKDAGYAGFGYLYAFDEKQNECIPDEQGWHTFLDAVKSKITRAVKAK